MSKSTKIIDIFISLASVLVIVLSVWWGIYAGFFTFDLNQDVKLTWHLVRSSGMVAYLLLLASTVWGLFISSQSVKDWSPGVVSLTVHSTLSWLAVILAVIHALLLLLDDYFTYTLADIFIPFIGPYRPIWVGLGTLSFWMLLLISFSFPIKKWMGHQNWKRLHYVSYLAFGAVSVHGLVAGTDGHLLGFRAMVGVGIGLVILLLGIRMGKTQVKSSPSVRSSSRSAQP